MPFGSRTIRFLDMGGSFNYRPLWKQNAQDIQGVIFVIDSSDVMRFQNAAEELHVFLEEPSIASSNIPLLIFASKNDIEDCPSLDEIETALCLNRNTGRPLKIMSVCSRFPAQLKQGLRWLIDESSHQS